MPGLYLHIPFCQSKCFYCDFASCVSTQEAIEEYLQTLDREMAYYSQDSRFRNVGFETIFVGGGTPSLLSVSQLDRLLSSLFRHFRFQPNMEASMEANPGSLTEEKVRIALTYGVRRFSVGVQSLDEKLLQRIGRGHTPEEARETLRILQKCGVENWNLDFMYGLPGQTIQQWQKTLQEAIAWQPPHLSLYNLIVEENTPFGRMQKTGELLLPEETQQLRMMELADQMTSKAGYEHYEISNYSKPGFECRHNLIYWQNEKYLGLGSAAYSYWNRHRFAHLSDVTEYLHHWEVENAPGLAEDEVATPEIEMIDTIFMGLRLMKGISYSEMNRRFSIDFRQKYREAIEFGLTQGWLEETEDQHLRFTPIGLPVSNQVLLRFLPD